MNRWFAECVPCRWQETFDTQDSAISAAEKHVQSAHADLFSLASDVRSRHMADKRIAHVQLRDDNAVGTGISTGAVTQASTVSDVLTDEELNAKETQLLAQLEDLDKLRALRTRNPKGGE